MALPAWPDCLKPSRSRDRRRFGWSISRTYPNGGSIRLRSQRKREETPGGAGNPPIVVDWEPVLHRVLEDVRSATPPSTIAARFHNGLVDAIVDVAQTVGQPRVVLTGGCFQNRLLTERATDALVAAGFEVLLHRQTPPNDGCVSLGQIAVAAAKLRGDVPCV